MLIGIFIYGRHQELYINLWVNDREVAQNCSILRYSILCYFCIMIGIFWVRLKNILRICYEITSSVPLALWLINLSLFLFKSFGYYDLFTYYFLSLTEMMAVELRWKLWKGYRKAGVVKVYQVCSHGMQKFLITGKIPWSSLEGWQVMIELLRNWSQEIECRKGFTLLDEVVHARFHD